MENNEQKPELLTTEGAVNARKTRIIMIALGIFAVVIVSSLIVTVYSFTSQPQAKKDNEQESDRKTENKVVNQPTMQKNWQEMAEYRFKQLDTSISSLTRVIEDLNKTKQSPQQPTPNITPKPPQIGGYNVVAPQPNNQPHPVPPPPPVVVTQVQTPNKASQPEPNKVIKNTGTFKEFLPDKDSNISKATTKEPDREVIIPDSRYRGVALNGIDAATMEYGRDNPLPFKVAITSEGVTAGDRTIDLKGCEVTGSGWGEVSSEKAYINLYKISCISKKGEILESRINGWLSDTSDGKIGIMGHVVSKQGAVLAKEFMAGALSGAADMYKQMSMTSMISPLGTTQTFNPNNIVQGGLAGGVSTAGDNLAKFYMKNAEKMFQVIEISPGKRVSVILSDGNGKGGGQPNKLVFKHIMLNERPLEDE